MSARQAQLARSFTAAQLDVVGLCECRLPGVQIGNAGRYTRAYSEGPKGCNGRLWITSVIAQHRHLAVLRQGPSRLAVADRAPTFSMHALVKHAPIKGVEDCAEWWEESRAHRSSGDLQRLPFPSLDVECPDMRLFHAAMQKAQERPGDPPLAP